MRWLIPKLEDFCVVMISLVVKEMIPLILKEMIPLLLKEMIPLLLAALDPRHTYFELLFRKNISAQRCTEQLMLFLGNYSWFKNQICQ